MNAAPICDYLDATIPLTRADEYVAQLHPLMLEAGASSSTLAGGDSYNTLYRVGEGTVRTFVRGAVLCVGASGAALAALRSTSLYANYLAVLGEGEHRVTRLDAALDVLTDAAPVIASLLDRGRMENIALTRKRVRASSIEFVNRVAHYDGVTVTGTLYVGKRTAEASAKVYDKRNERIDAGEPDPGPWLRIEVTARGKLNPSLRDAWVPGELFYHLAAPDLVARPLGIAEWTPRGEGFVLPTRTKLDPAAAMKRRVDASLELEALLELADRAGPEGRNFLLSLLRRRVLGVRPVPHAAADSLPTAVSAAQKG